MPANIDPIYSRAANNQWIVIPASSTANTNVDGSGTLGSTIWQLFQADSTNGGFVKRIRIKAASINTATVLRFFINNNGANGTAANNTFFDEITIPAITGTNNAAVPFFDLPFGEALDPSHRILVTQSVQVTSAIYLTAIAGKY